MAAAAPIQRDVALASAIRNEDRAAVQRRLEMLDQQIGAQRIVLVVDGFGPLRDRLAGRRSRRPRRQLQNSKRRADRADHGLGDLARGPTPTR